MRRLIALFASCAALAAFASGVQGPLASCAEPVGHEFQVNASTTGIQDRFAGACGAGCLIAWGNREQTYDDTSLVARRVDGLGPLGSEFRVDSGTNAYAEAPAVAADVDGFLTVVWSESGSPWSVRTRSYDARGEAGPEIALSDFAGNQFWPAISAGPVGLVAAWGRNSDVPEGHGIFARRFAGANDADGSGVVDVRDVFWLINHLFCGGPPPVGSGDVTRDGTVDVSDVFVLIEELFSSHPTQGGGGTPGPGPCSWWSPAGARKP